MSARPVLALVALGAAAWLLVAVFGGGDAAEAQPAQAFTSSAQCKECHPEVYAEWEGSQHAMSWVNPAVRMLSNDFANQDCIDCHAPRPVFVTGIGERVLPRATRRPEGVDCIACHQLPEEMGGGIAGTIDDPRAACRPQAVRALVQPEFCAGCHNQHKTVDQWHDSIYPAQGKDCLTCHMPYRDGDPRRGRHHGFPGGNDLAMLRSAVELTGGVEDGRYLVVVENVGAGHAFPTDERSRAADLFWRPLADAGGGPETWRHLHRIRDPYRFETDIPSTLLHASERRELDVPLSEAPEGIEVALFYKRSPYWEEPDRPDPDREATLVHRIALEP